MKLYKDHQNALRLQVIPGLGAQRLMGPKVVRFAREKSLSLLRPVIFLCCNP